jgi:hypothetical protein
MQPNRKTDVLIAIGLFLPGILTRVPFRSRFLYHWDSVNFALGLEHFDIYQHQPHPPGYFLYVMTGRLVRLLVGDANASLVWMSVLAAGLTAAATFWLGRSLWNRRAGIVASLLFLTSPLFWFHGEVALSYMVEALFVVLVALLCYGHLKGTDERVWLSALVLGVAGGFRPNTMVFLLPLWAVAVWRYRWRRALGAAGVLAGVGLAWLAPMVILTGGIARYTEALRAAGEIVAAESSLSGAAQLAVNGFRLGMFTFYALGAGLVPLAVGGLYGAVTRRSQWRAWAKSPEFRLFFWWLAPSLFFYALIHIRQPGHTFTFMPALLLLLGGLLGGGNLPGLARGWAWALTGLVVLVNALFFLIAPPSLFGGQHLTLTPPTWPTIRARDASLEGRVGYIRAHLSPEETVILANGLDFRHPDFYLREYPVVRFAALPVTTTLSLPPSVTTVVLFGEDLQGENCPTSNPGALVSPDLCLLYRRPDQTVVVEGNIVRVR